MIFQTQILSSHLRSLFIVVIICHPSGPLESTPIRNTGLGRVNSLPVWVSAAGIRGGGRYLIHHSPELFIAAVWQNGFEALLHMIIIGDEEERARVVYDGELCFLKQYFIWGFVTGRWRYQSVDCLQLDCSWCSE